MPSRQNEISSVPRGERVAAASTKNESYCGINSVTTGTQILPVSSVVELLRSARFSDGVILLEHEDDGVTQPDSFPAAMGAGKAASDVNTQSAETAEGDDAKCLMLENAVRVALLLARSFANLCHLSEISYDNVRHNLSVIQLDDFFINLEHGENDTSSIVDGQSNGSGIQPSVGFFSQFDGKNGDYHDHFVKPVSKKSKKKKRKKKPTIKEKLIQAALAADIRQNSEGNHSNPTLDGTSSNKAANGVSRSSAASSARRYKTYPRWLLVEVKNLTPESLDYSQKQQDQYTHAILPLQILGKLLYSVFSLGKPLPSDLLCESTQPTTAPCIEYDSIDGHNDYNKRRLTERSFFSKLIESSTFPVSICRLLSDMIDIGLKGKADLPFTSFEDVIQELEQMKSQPRTLLHNDPNSSSFGKITQSPVFGQQYYGRKEEIFTLMEVTHRMEQSSLHPGDKHDKCAQSGVEAVFLSGIAGSGKSHLVQEVGESLSGLGWIVIKAKFKRGMEHASRMIVSSMFDELIVNLVKMKDSGVPSDVAYCQRVSKSILDAIGYDGLSLLVGFLPSLPSLFDGISGDGDEARQRQVEDSEWILIHLLSKIIEAILDDRFIMICGDDLQWADKTALSLISEILINIGDFKSASRHLLFVGLYRDNAVDDHHPFSIQYSHLQMSSSINTTEITLRDLSKEAVVDIISTEFRLTRRSVVELADVVYKKTSGHAFFVVELLNSVLRDSTIAYNMQKRRYAWDQDRIDFIQTSDTVAGLIASNLSYLPASSQRVLQILSCFGTQTDLPLLRILEGFEEGITLSLDIFVEKGILDRAGPLVIFTHDLIQEEAYLSMSSTDRQTLHLQMGQFLGSMAGTDAPSLMEAEATGLDHLQLGIDQLHLNDHEFFVGSRSMTSSLTSLACDQINSVGSKSVSDEDQKQKFAQWNVLAGKMCAQQSDFRAALYYFSKGISFLGENCWSIGSRLCIDLYEGAVMAAYALGETDSVAQYAKVIENAASFEDSLEVQAVALRSLSHSGTNNAECISKGIDILQRLGCDVPSAPTNENVMNAMASTDSIASKFSIDQIVNLCEKTVDFSTYSAVKIMDAIYVSCYESGSPHLPLIACELVKYSLQHAGICQQSTAAFATFGMLKIFREGDYAAGRYYADVVRAIIKKHQALNNSKMMNDGQFRSELILYLAIDIWFSTPRVISVKISEVYHGHAMRLGAIDSAMISLQMSWRYSLYGGENLALLLQTAEDRIRLVAKHSIFIAKFMAVSNLLLTELTGKSGDYLSVFKGSICDMDDLQAEAESNKNVRLIYQIYCHKFFIAFWRGDCFSAEVYSHKALLMSPVSKLPTVLLIYQTFFGGLVAFSVYRTLGGDDRLREGREMMNRFEKWAQNSMIVFENKWLLLKAEYSASIHENDVVEQTYKKSIKVSHDHGNIHELALAYELFGNYYLDHGFAMNSKECYNKAYLHYTQWGATAVADRILHKHNLDVGSLVDSNGRSKNSRQSD